jgi:hypothetical protein
MLGAPVSWYGSTNNAIERQVSELHANSSITHEPVTPSQLLRSESVSDVAAPQIPSAASASGPAGEQPKEE